MDGSMNALADKVHKKGMSLSDMHSITGPHYSSTIHTFVGFLLLLLLCSFYSSFYEINTVHKIVVH